MEFNSLAYALFLAAVVAIYYSPLCARASWRQNALLLAGSYVFYGAWDWRFLSLILLTTLSTYAAALLIEHRRQRVWLVANIVLNVGILATFKYFNFFTENLAWLMKWFGWEMDWFTIDVLLPVGISFYTFQAIGYSIDVWRGTIRPTRNLLLFATFIAFFPQLIAGPIERTTVLMPQLARVNRWNYREAVGGLRFILWGLLKKVAVADPCGAVVDSYYGSSMIGEPDGLRIYFAGVLFLIQVYCDFSGYCDIATGSARLLGVKLTMNFNRPFISRNFLDLWSRWHITLTHWFTDYVYIPLGGSRRGKARMYANVALVFFLSGLWHGAGWGFIIWGCLSGLLYCLQKALGYSNMRHAPEATLADFPAIFTTFSIFAITTVPVRLNYDIGYALEWCWRYVIPLSLMAIVAFRVGFAALRIGFKAFRRGFATLRKGFAASGNVLQAPQRASSAGWLMRRRLYFSALALLAVCGFVFAYSLTVMHLYLLTALLFYGCEWTTRHLPWGECPFPLPRRRVWRMAFYMLLYILILTYGLLRLPPVVDATTFLYFQF